MKKKLYYSIGEVTEIIDVKAHIIRYWESEIPQLKTKSANVRNRRYSEKDIVLLRLLKELIYEKKFTLEGAKIAIREIKQSEQLVKKEKKTPEKEENAIILPKDKILEQLREIKLILLNK